MIRPLSFFIGLRYTRAKRYNHFISFISLVSMLGIALGMTVLIIVLSVMNGFDHEVRKQFFSMAPEVTVLTNQAQAHTLARLQKRIQHWDQVVASAPFVSGRGVLMNQDGVSPVDVLGIIPAQEKDISKIAQNMVAGHLSSLTSGSYHIVIGKKLADHLGVDIYDKLRLLTPRITTTPLGVFPKMRRFTITGLFDTRGGFGFDSVLVYVNQSDAKRLFPAGEAGLHIKIKNVYKAPVLAKQLRDQLSSQLFVTDWTERYGSFFRAIAMEKVMMFCILLLIIAVAVFNLVATLVMMVNDKRMDVAILRTLGATPRMIMFVFIIQGALIGLVGIAIGVALGVVLALNATEIVAWVQGFFHVQFISKSVYFVNFLPSQLQWYDVFRVSLVAFILSLLATIYPAVIAFRVQPMESLRDE